MQTLLRTTNAYRRIGCESASGQIGHATLMLFPDEIYLRNLLKECAKAFFGAEDGSRTARLIDTESYSDCVFFPAAGEKMTVPAAAKLTEESNLRPVEGSKKLFVLDAFHTVTPLVQNKLLKLLEEPADGVYFLIGACTEHSLLPTVLSRVNQIVVPPFSSEQISRALGRNYPEENCSEAAAACGGIYSAAEALLGGAEVFRLAERYLLGADVRIIREIGERKDKRAFLSALKLLLRDMLFYRTGRDKYVAVKTPEAERLSMLYPEGAILESMRLTDETEKQIQFNANFAQALFTLAIMIGKEKEKWQKLS